MNYVIILFGLLITVLSLFILVKPQGALDYFRANAGSMALYITAIAVRVGMGLALILYADQSLYPAAFVFIGYLVLAAGVILALIGHKRFQRLVTWAMGLFDKMARVAGLLGIVLGIFLIHAVT